MYYYKIAKYVFIQQYNYISKLSIYLGISKIMTQGLLSAILTYLPQVKLISVLSLYHLHVVQKSVEVQKQCLLRIKKNQTIIFIHKFYQILISYLIRFWIKQLGVSKKLPPNTLKLGVSSTYLVADCLKMRFHIFFLFRLQVLG